MKQTELAQSRRKGKFKDIRKSLFNMTKETLLEQQPLTSVFSWSHISETNQYDSYLVPKRSQGLCGSGLDTTALK